MPRGAPKPVNAVVLGMHAQRARAHTHTHTHTHTSEAPHVCVHARLGFANFSSVACDAHPTCLSFFLCRTASIVGLKAKACSLFVPCCQERAAQESIVSRPLPRASTRGGPRTSAPRLYERGAMLAICALPTAHYDMHVVYRIKSFD